jgi:hypothetical protein
LNRHFTSVLGRRSLTVDDVDLPGGYDPRDHFDNGYIDESWKQVAGRLEQFKANGVRNLDAFHRAAHAIGDFYAHSSYAQFGATQQGKLILYDPANPASSLPRLPDYGPGSSFDFVSLGLSSNPLLWKGSEQEAAALWKGKLISGRYAQKGDAHSITETITFIPSFLTRDRDFPLRGSLPHHNEIAVDEDQGTNKLYDGGEFSAQYLLRKDAAVRHIRQAFVDNWRP